MDDVDIESKLIAYATEFLRSYTETVDTKFPGSFERISELGMEATYFPLYERRLGEDTAIAVLFIAKRSINRPVHTPRYDHHSEVTLVRNSTGQGLGQDQDLNDCEPGPALQRIGRTPHAA
jgi:hypothetical protein